MSDPNKFINALHWKTKGQLLVPYKGLLVPYTYSERRENPNLKEVLTHSDVRGEFIPLNRVIEMVKGLPLIAWIKFISVTSIYLDREGFFNLDAQKDLARSIITSDKQKDLLQRMDQYNRYFFNPRTLVSLLKLAFAYAPNVSSAAPSDQSERLVEAYLGLTDHMDVDFERQFAVDQDSAVVRWAVQNIDFFSNLDLVESLCRTHDVLCKLPPERKWPLSSPLIPQDVLLQEEGLDLQSYMAATLALIVSYYDIDFSSAQSIDEHWVLNENAFFKNAKIKEQCVKKSFSRFVLTENHVNAIKNKILDDPNYFFEFNLFRERPLYPVSEGTYAPIYFPFFRWRVTEGIYWDIWACSGGRREIYTQAHGYWFEEYIQRLFEKVYPGLSGLQQRLFRGTKVKDTDPAYDIAIIDPNAYILIETKASRFQYSESIVQGNMGAILKDLEKLLFEPAEQLNKFISSFERGDVEVNGNKWKGEVIFPVLILYDAFPTFDPLWGYFMSKVASKGWLQQSKIMPLIVLSAEEAAMLASLVMNGKSISDILAGKNLDKYRGVPFKNFALERYGSISLAKNILGPYWDELTGKSRAILFGGLST
jgi:hypothetical protein